MIERDETDVNELWLQYFANGGNADPFEFEAFLYDVHESSTLDLDLLNFAIEELHAPRKRSQPEY